MTFAEAQRLLADAGQSHVLAFWDRLDASARARLLDQVASIDWDAVARLRGFLPGAGGPAAERSGGPLAGLEPEELEAHLAFANRAA
ncbi:MAG: hypothetical protein IJL06_07710, partial [Kiritimatiellae bacterium]|nr:hypothetical protein [Kiritimatiellia bacterium]